MFRNYCGAFSVCLFRLRYIFLLTFLFFFIFTFLPYRGHQFQLESISDFAQSTKLNVIRPGNGQVDNDYDPDLIKEEPWPFEPGGKIGTLRDVRDEQFYKGGTLSLTASNDSDGSHPTPSIYDPYPDYNSDQWKESWLGEFIPCQGPRGRDLDRRNPGDMMLAYAGNLKNFPRPKFGEYDLFGLDGQVCADRYGRFSAYGYGEGHDPATPGFNPQSPVVWDKVNWKKLESQCFKENAERYKTEPTQLTETLLLPSQLSSKDVPQKSTDVSTIPSSQPQHKPRSAFLLRAWHDLNWSPNLKSYIRSMIMELSLHSGAEYEVFILVHVKDDTPIHTDEESVRRLKDKYIPSEFHDMAILFNDKMLETWYPNVMQHKPIFQHFQPVQIFSQTHPNFDYYWQFEVDSRHTGHMYHFLDRVVEFAKQQPRKYLWERNAYFYSRDAHGPWDRFMSMVDDSMVGLPSVWGPVPAEGVTPIGPTPPVLHASAETYEWVVGEEADMISFLPIFNPEKTSWTFSDMLWNLPLDVPRRASPVTMGRTSKRLLQLMHDAQVQDGIGVVSEMTPATFSLWHGLKAVHAPHPIYADGKWTPRELERIMNKGTPENINGGTDSIWSWGHAFDHIIYRFSYMFVSQFAEDLFRRWMGYEIDPNQYTEDLPHQDPQGRNWYDSGDLREDIYGRLCYPPMLLHPVKNPEKVKDGPILGLA